MIGQRIQQARKARGLSLRDLANEVGVSQTAISKYENERNLPSSGVLLRISQALNVKIDYFFRPIQTPVELQMFRKHASLGVKQQNRIQIVIQDWVERYIEVENLYPDMRLPADLPVYSVSTLDEIESAASDLREHWGLGYDPIENLVQILEDQGIKVGIVEGDSDFDACTFKVEQFPVVVTKFDLPGDRQRFNLGHELGHLVLRIAEDMEPEQAANRFAGAFLAPARSVFRELGEQRTNLNVNELYLLKRKYGLSMQAWIYRAKDLKILSDAAAIRLFKRFRAEGWRQREPGEPYPSELPMRMDRLIYHALAEDLISQSRAQELLGKPLRWLGNEGQGALDGYLDSDH